jgi:hypothetical protein
MERILRSAVTGPPQRYYGPPPRYYEPPGPQLRLDLVTAVSTVSTTADAADGCGRGWYYNGRRCVPMDEPGYCSPAPRGRQSASLRTLRN